ncbi:MAG TPA: hypothetical protein VLA52_12780 [Thermohalobaculum sp.]|nr:hypothetical protein [Thermohalobaculum sp.]
MSGDGDSTEPKRDVLASIRKIMRGGSADLGDVPPPGSKAEGTDAVEQEDWSIPPGALSPAEGGAPSEPAPEDGPSDLDDDDDDDVLPLSAAMQVGGEDAAATTPPPAADGMDDDDDDEEEPLELAIAIPQRPSAPDPDDEDESDAGPADEPAVAEEPGSLDPDDFDPLPGRFSDEDVPEMETAPADEPDLGAIEEFDIDSVGDDSSEDPIPRRWDWSEDDELRNAAPETERPAAMSALDEFGAEDALAVAGAGLSLGEIEDTIRRVVREELEGDIGQRLSQNLRGMIQQEIARALQRGDD